MKSCAVLTLVILCALSSATLMSAQRVSFTAKSIAKYPYTFATADLNNDGREDLISVCGSGVGNGNGEFAISLSTGDGTYAPQVCYALPTGAISGVAVGDFNGDGNLDLAVINGTNSFYEYLNKGDGTFRLQTTFVTKTSQITFITAADVNHDGRIDLVWDGFNDTNLYVYFGNGDGGFTVGPTSTIQVPGELSIGDFDGDGNADILSQFNTYGNSIQVDYGDGHGHFTETPVISDDAVYRPYDLNGDGRMDLIGDPFDFSLNGSTFYKTVRVMYGNANRTFTTQEISLSQCTGGAEYPAVADFNGDGLQDIAVEEASDCQGGQPYRIDILPGKGSGAYGPEKSVFSSNYAGSLDIIRANRDTKPDIRSYGESQGTVNSKEITLLNTSSGTGFPACNPPNRGIGIALCSPTSEVVASSPVTFSVGAANQTPGRKVEVWIDGKKAGEELNGWSHYGFLDAQYNVANGTHAVTIYSAGWHNLLQKVTFPLTVGSTQCAPPPSAGLNVCSPLPDSSLGTGVLAWASGTVTGTIARMEVWVDGVKKYSTYGSDTLKTNISLAAGSHTFAYYIVNTSGKKWEKTVVATVE